ncbi:2-deoxy-D-gluconate 3-dehydrogenase [Aspergillus saccharolyticus JOP 1030-1]|uniref:2-deoxy-D-gluconate 3-dehydrogenase n=1 Tax=Aspergillus saccharolyticus JOP 1030-1 TaxID=1450539 RepID=A0A318ZSN4_9EURO|nr:2-deoxy-D-gluconate 3-dehydrogenase [Aspergillus saccharolyticus JOP 1030-1]PYH47373.1 2-deoxy-D-gluconate 3-dehydrogenase [Aspergillus saccharolyticus JOP 1030-1]
MDLFSLPNSTALVTGGTRGIGQQMALALAEAGSDIILVQRDTTNQTTKTLIESLNRKATIYTADLSNREDVTTLVPRILADGHDITILVNCAGIQRRHPSHLFPDSDWDAVLQTNLTTVFTLSRDVGRYMLTREPDSHGQRGAIINVASLVSFQGGLTVPAYAAAKGGVAQLTKALSNEWAARGVRVNAIAPGYVATEMNTALLRDEARAKSILDRIPAGRWASPEDFKGVTVFLAGRASAYVSGSVVVVDGGWMGR